MNQITVSAVACLLLLAGCGKNDSADNNLNQNVDQTAKPTELGNKTTAEVLTLKYKKAILTCSLWSQRGNNINLDITPDDSASLDLKEDLTYSQVLELNAAIQDHQIKITLEVTKLSHYGYLHHTDSNGNEVSARYSPYVKINYSKVSNSVFGEGQIGSSSGSEVRTVNERIEDMVLNQSLKTEPAEANGSIIEKGALNDYVSCIIETDMNPEYSDQFTYTPVKY